MKKHLLKSTMVLALCLMFAAPAAASGVFTGVKASTLGVGVDLGYQINDWFKIRLNGNYLPIEFDGDFEEVEYEVDFKHLTIGGLLDVHPFAGKFRISAGVYYRDLDLDLKASPNEDVEIGGYTFRPQDIGTIKGNITFDKWAPYIGLGWGTGAGKQSRFDVNVDVGAMYLKGVKIKYHANGNIANPSYIGSIPPQYAGSYQDYVDAVDKEVKDIEDDIDKWKFYPVVNIGFTWRF